MCIKIHLFLRLPRAANCRSRGVKRACVWDWNELKENSYANRPLRLFSQASPGGCPLPDFYQLLFPAHYSESFKNKAWNHASSIASTDSYLNFPCLHVSNKGCRTHWRLIMRTLPTWEACWKKQMSRAGDEWLPPGDIIAIQAKSLGEDQPGRH